MNVRHFQLKFHNTHTLSKLQNHCGTYSVEELMQAMTLRFHNAAADLLSNHGLNVFGIPGSAQNTQRTSSRSSRTLVASMFEVLQDIQKIVILQHFFITFSSYFVLFPLSYYYLNFREDNLNVLFRTGHTTITYS